jgi:hypothetical protein
MDSEAAATPIRWERARAKPPVTGCTHPRAHDHRCAGCGRLLYVYLFMSPGRRAERHVAACEDHPDADAVCWQLRVQAAAIAVCQEAALLALRRREEPTFAHLEEAIERFTDEIADLDAPTRRGTALLSIRQLLRDWHGLPPGRVFPEQPATVQRPSLY